MMGRSAPNHTCIDYCGLLSDRVKDGFYYPIGIGHGMLTEDLQDHELRLTMYTCYVLTVVHDSSYHTGNRGSMRDWGVLRVSFDRCALTEIRSVNIINNLIPIVVCSVCTLTGISPQMCMEVRMDKV